MNRAIEAKEFFDLSLLHQVFDVRTPAEFEHGHIPGAFNLPLFSNEERAEIGTIYKHQGREQAIGRGMEIVKPKFMEFIRMAEKFAPLPPPESRTDDNTTILVHCWRGGMRSAGMAQLLGWWGYKVITLKGGYKSFRRMALGSFLQKRTIRVLGGSTGSGKTAILEELGKKGATVLDLERLANHKGSAFGSLGEQAQPTQEMFENETAVRLLKVPPDQMLWVEDESQNIGKRIIPNAFFEQMRTAEVCYVQIPVELRIEYLTREYGKFSKEELIRSIEKIWKRVGPQHAKAAITAIRNGDIKKACEICLVYYDKSYAHGMAKRQAASVLKKPFMHMNPEAIARELLQ